MMDKVKMKCPDGVTSCSANGEQFDADEKGEVLVDVAYIDHLAQHGFTVVPVPEVPVPEVPVPEVPVPEVPVPEVPAAPAAQPAATGKAAKR